MVSPMLHPYFKLAYIKHVWGGPEEQEAEHDAGNLFVKDWQDEARKILEHAVHVRPSFTNCYVP